MNSRRKFIAVSAAAITGAALPKMMFAERLGGEVFSNANLGAYAQGLLSQTTFESVVGSPFRVFLDDDSTLDLILRSVTSCGPTKADVQTAQNAPGPQNGYVSIVKIVKVGGAVAAATPQLVSFDLHFDFSGDAFPQATYTVDHGTLGSFAVFLVPVAAGVCVATFCYLQNTSSTLADSAATARAARSGPATL